MLKWFFSLVVLFASVNQYVEASAPKINEIFIDSDHSKLFCRTMGEGKPLIVIHGGPGLSQDYLLPQLSKLAENHFVILYDQRGCGRSTGEINQDTINVQTFLNDLDAIRTAFHFDRVSLLGHSWGAFLAMHYAIAHPGSVNKLILSNSMPASLEDFSLFLNEWVQRMAPYQSELSAIKNTKAFQEGNPEIVERSWRIIFRTYCDIPEKADLLNLRMSSIASVNGVKVYENFRQNTFQKPFNLHDSLKTIQIPTLVIHGDKDSVPAVTARHIHESIPGSTYILLKNCGHFPYVEQPEDYFNALNEFLK